MPLSVKGRSQGSAIGNTGTGTGGAQLAVCVVISVVLFTVSCATGSDGPLEVVRSAVQTVASPVRYLGDLVTSPLDGLSNVFANLTADQATLTELEAQVAELEAQVAELEEAQQTAERLQELLDLQDAYSLQSTAARIISDSTDSWTSTVTIDKGSTSGIEVGMPVTSATGVIGQVIEVSATTSVVRLLTDENSSISAMVQSTRVQGMLEGSASGTVELTLVRTSQTVEVGDIIVTSGIGGVFPKGLPLGTVTSVEDTGDLYLTITVELYAEVESAEEVLVITSLTEDQMADADDIAEADAQQEDDSVASDDEADSDSDDGTEDSDDGSDDETGE